MTDKAMMCEECQRPYMPEADHDPGVCCICARDFRMEAQYGAEWREALKIEIAALAALGTR